MVPLFLMNPSPVIKQVKPHIRTDEYTDRAVYYAIELNKNENEKIVRQPLEWPSPEMRLNCFELLCQIIFVD